MLLLKDTTTKATLAKESIYLRDWLQFENISCLSTGWGTWQHASRHDAEVCKQTWCGKSSWDICILIHRQQAKRVWETVGMMGTFEASKHSLSNTPCPKRPRLLILPNSLPTGGTFLFKTPQRTTRRCQLSPTMELKNKTQVVRFDQQISSLTKPYRPFII